MSILAHVGHPITTIWDGLLHPFTGADHLLAIVGVGVVAALSSSRRIAVATPIGFLAAMVLGGVLGTAGLTPPAVEVLLAGTVLATGLLVLLRGDRLGVVLPVAAASFGLLHGIAHGSEAPLGALPIAYAAGFVGATAGLHLAGFAVGRTLRLRNAARLTVGSILSGAGLLLLTSV